MYTLSIIGSNTVYITLPDSNFLRTDITNYHDILTNQSKHRVLMIWNN